MPSTCCAAWCRWHMRQPLLPWSIADAEQNLRDAEAAAAEGRLG